MASIKEIEKGGIVYDIKDETARAGLTSKADSNHNHDNSYSASGHSHSYNDLSNKPTIPTVDVTKSYVDTELAKKSDDNHTHSDYASNTHNHDTSYSQLNHTHNYATQSDITTAIANASLGDGSVSLDGYATETYVDNAVSTKANSTHSHSYNDLSNKPTIPVVDVTKSYVDTALTLKSDTTHNHDNSYASASHTHSNYATTSHNHDSSYSNVSHSHNYNDLSNTPTIPTVTNDLTNTLKSNYDSAYTHSQSEHYVGTPLSYETSTTKELQPNTFYKWGEVSSLTITLATPTNTEILSEYMFEFKSGTTSTNLTLPSTITFAEDVTIEANKTYQFSILNSIGVMFGV